MLNRQPKTKIKADDIAMLRMLFTPAQNNLAAGDVDVRALTLVTAIRSTYL